MNIEAKPGDKVRFIYPWWGTKYDQEQATKHLKVGEIYTVDYVNAHSFSSTVHLREVPNWYFNTVLFDDDDQPIVLSRLLELLSPSVGHPGTKEAQHRAHETICVWIAQQVQTLEIRVRELEAEAKATRDAVNDAIWALKNVTSGGKAIALERLGEAFAGTEEPDAPQEGGDKP